MVAQERRPPMSFSRGVSSDAVCLSATAERHLVESGDVELQQRRLEKTLGERRGDLQQVVCFSCSVELATVFFVFNRHQ